MIVGVVELLQRVHEVVAQNEIFDCGRGILGVFGAASIENIPCVTSFLICRSRFHFRLLLCIKINIFNLII